MKRPRPLSGCLLFVLALARPAAPMRAATEARPETLGFSPERLERLDCAIQAEVDQHRIAGVVA